MTQSSQPIIKHAYHWFNQLQQPLYWWYEKRLIKAVKEAGKVPKHLGIILDGNRRFAKNLNLDTKIGHEFGAQKAYEVLDWCLEMGIPHVTIWIFSSDNKNRNPEEVGALLELFAREARKMLTDERIHRNKVRIKMIGQQDEFPEKVRHALRQLEEATVGYDHMLLHIAVGYGGREEIVSAVRRVIAEQAQQGKHAQDIAAELSAQHISNALDTAGSPDPDFIIRTSGEIRLSGFLLWQSAYSEYYFCDAYWPSFRKVDFLRAIRSFQDRERRFGK